MEGWSVVKCNSNASGVAIQTNSASVSDPDWCCTTSFTPSSVVRKAVKSFPRQRKARSKRPTQVVAISSCPRSSRNMFTSTSAKVPQTLIRHNNNMPLNYSGNCIFFLSATSIVYSFCQRVEHRKRQIIAKILNVLS